MYEGRGEWREAEIFSARVGAKARGSGDAGSVAAGPSDRRGRRGSEQNFFFFFETGRYKRRSLPTSCAIAYRVFPGQNLGARAGPSCHWHGASGRGVSPYVRADCGDGDVLGSAGPVHRRRLLLTRWWDPRGVNFPGPSERAGGGARLGLVSRVFPSESRERSAAPFGRGGPLLAS